MGLHTILLDRQDPDRLFIAISAAGAFRTTDGDLANVNREVTVEVEGSPTLGSVLEALEQSYPVLRDTIRDHITRERRPFIRYFACEEDLSTSRRITPCQRPW